MDKINYDVFKNLCVVSAPSGAGKTSLIKKICSHEKISVSVSETTRKPRKGEINGTDYIFIDESEFSLRVKKEIYIEHALVHGNYYGTSIDSVSKNKLKRDNIHNPTIKICIFPTFLTPSKFNTTIRIKKIIEKYSIEIVVSPEAIIKYAPKPTNAKALLNILNKSTACLPQSKLLWSSIDTHDVG